MKTLLLAFFLAIPVLLFSKPLTEEEKIVKLIDYIEHLQGVVFVRNGSEYTPIEAAAHLRLKRNKAGSKIKTAREFIENLASTSSVSGKPYLIKYIKDGKTLMCSSVLKVELDRLNKLN